LKCVRFLLSSSSKQKISLAVTKLSNFFCSDSTSECLPSCLELTQLLWFPVGIAVDVYRQANMMKCGCTDQSKPDSWWCQMVKNISVSADQKQQTDILLCLW